MRSFIPSVMGLGHLLVHFVCELTPTVLALAGGWGRFREESRVPALQGLLCLVRKTNKAGTNGHLGGRARGCRHTGWASNSARWWSGKVPPDMWAGFGFRKRGVNR